MNPVTKRFAWVGVGALSAFVITVPASADDTELFLGAANGVNTAQPNILFIIDDSGSMGVSTGSVQAFHFDIVSVGKGPRNASSTHTQSFYQAGPGGP